MSERTINILAGIASFLLVFVYFWYMFVGRPFGITYAFLPILSITGTFTFLAVHQFLIAHEDEPRHPFTRPVSFRWVLALNYAGFSFLLWWIILTYFFGSPLDPWLRRLVWLQAALGHIWFLRRFIIWDRPKETKSARDIRQEATDVRQDARDVFQDERERRIGT